MRTRKLAYLPSIVGCSLLLAFTLASHASSQELSREDMYKLHLKEIDILQKQQFEEYPKLFADKAVIEGPLHRDSQNQYRSDKITVPQLTKMFKADLSKGTVVKVETKQSKNFLWLYITLKTSSGQRLIGLYDIYDFHYIGTPSGAKIIERHLNSRRWASAGKFSEPKTLVGDWVRQDFEQDVDLDATFYADGTVLLKPRGSSPVGGNWKRLDDDHIRLDVRGVTDVWKMTFTKEPHITDAYALELEESNGKKHLLRR